MKSLGKKLATLLCCLFLLTACRESPPFPEPESWTEARVGVFNMSYEHPLPADMWQELWAYLEGAERCSEEPPQDWTEAPLTIRIAHTGSEEQLLLLCFAGEGRCLIEAPASGGLWETGTELYVFLHEYLTAL